MVERKTYGDEGYELMKIQRTQRSQGRTAFKKSLSIFRKFKKVTVNTFLRK